MRKPTIQARIDRPEPARIKIYGERNTGTGYLQAMLVRNLEVDCLRGGVPKVIRRLFPDSERVRDRYFRWTARRNLGWKHANPPSRKALAAARADPTRLLFLTMTKNPYAWLLSLHRSPYHAKREPGSFEAFLSTPWETVGRENAPAVFPNPVEIWNRKNAAYLALGEYANTLNYRYEEWLARPFQLLEALCSEHGLRPRHQQFENVREAVKRHDRGKTFDDYRDYYLKERWRDELDENCIRLINERLDRRVAAHFQYPLIEA